MRWWLTAACLALANCGTAPAPPPSAPKAAEQSWYGPTVSQLAAVNQKAEEAFRSGKPDAAAALLVQGQSLSNRLLSVQDPTLPAMEAASDLDDLYGRMLLSNRHYGWARMLFQRNVARWRHWQPETPETVRRRQRALDQITECDRRLTE